MKKTIKTHKDAYNGNTYIFCLMNRMFTGTYINDRDQMIKAHGSVEAVEAICDKTSQLLCLTSSSLLNGIHKPKTIEAIRLLARKC